MQTVKQINTIQDQEHSLDKVSIIESFLAVGYFTNNFIQKDILLSKEDRLYQNKVSLEDSFIIPGKNGIGKTYYCHLFVRDWICKNFPNGYQTSSNYQLIPSIINQTKLESYMENQSWETELYIQEMIESKLLFFDDLWSPRGTERFKNIVMGAMFDIFDYRYNQNLQTIITTNMDLKTLAQGNDDWARVVSRINGLCSEIKLPNQADLRDKAQSITPKEVIEI